MRKIMFNDRYGLTAAVLTGRKTMTRRIVPQAVLDMWNNREWMRVRTPYPDYYNMSMEEFCLEHAHYQLGEVVAVAQAYKDVCDDILTKWGHKTDIAAMVLKESAGWNNKMFVRADYMPHKIRITNIRVESLQDISGEDIQREGIEYDEKTDRFMVGEKSFFAGGDALHYLIDKVSGKGTWNKNSLVFVYEFELIK